MPFRDTFTTEDKTIHHMYVVTSKDITSEAKQIITEGKYPHKGYISFLGGAEILEELLRSYE